MTVPTMIGLARMTVSSSGTGTVTLNSAMTGFNTFDASYLAATGSTTPTGGIAMAYAISDTNQSELGIGTYFSSNTTLTRMGSSLVANSSRNFVSTNGSTSLINMSNAAQVFVTPTPIGFPGALLRQTVYSSTTGSPFTWNMGTGTSRIIVEVIGAGGGGGGSVLTLSTSLGASGGGGGGGGYAMTNLVSPSSSYTVTVGGGGAGGAATGTAGSSGGATSVGAIAVATGGGGGAGRAVASVSNQTEGGDAGQGTTGDLLYGGQPGGLATTYSEPVVQVIGWGGAGGMAAKGGGGGKQHTLALGLGFGEPGFFPGGGGSGGVSSPGGGSGRAGGNGATGVAIIWEYS